MPERASSSTEAFGMARGKMLGSVWMSGPSWKSKAAGAANFILFGAILLAILLLWVYYWVLPRLWGTGG